MNCYYYYHYLTVQVLYGGYCMLRKLLFCWFTYVFVIVFFLYIFYPLVLSNLVWRHICDFHLLHVPCTFNAIGDHNSEKPQTVWNMQNKSVAF